MIYQSINGVIFRLVKRNSPEKHLNDLSMKNQKTPIKTDLGLRQKAEAFLNERKRKDAVTSITEPGKLISELELHQLELELQNEELSLAMDVALLAEKKYTELYDFAPLGYLSLTEAGEVTNLNRSAERLLEREHSSLINSRFGFFVSLEMKPVYNEFLQKVFETKLIQSCELKLEIDEDTVKYVLVNGIRSSNDEKCLMTLTDTTQLKEVEYELIQARQKAEENDRLKSAFLANMSHEIRTPMNGILGFTELLKTPKLTGAEQQNFITIIEKSGLRMLSIINDIVNISRIESGQVEINVSYVNINEQLEDVFNFFKPEAEQRKIHFAINIPFHTQAAVIETDKEKVYAVLTNLVKNALKFTRSGSIEIGYERKGVFLEFSVKDTGPGIPLEQRGIIFERFRQGSESLTRNYEGSGLGLTISRAYVEMLGGEIWFESEIGEGSTFYFTIPFVNGIEEKEKLQAVAAEKNRSDRKLKILVVEDDETAQQLLEIMVKPFYSSYFQSYNGKDGVETCRKNPDIDLILMDINMPGMSGYEATRQIREFNKEVVIIAQTAYALNGDREQSIEAGCNDYISKPINRLALISLINQYFS